VKLNPGAPQPGVISPGKEFSSYIEVKLKGKIACIPLLQKLAAITLKLQENVVLSLGTTLKSFCSDRTKFIVEQMEEFPRLVKMPSTTGEIFFHIKADTSTQRFILSDQIRTTMLQEVISKSLTYTEDLGFTFKPNPSSTVGSDLSGFEDGTMNPQSKDDRSRAAVLQNGDSFQMTQKWVHNLAKWKTFNDAQQEKMIGRSKVGSKLLDGNKNSTHVKRVDQKSHGFQIVRHSTPFGDSLENGLFFIAYSIDLTRFSTLLIDMDKLDSEGSRDAIIDNLTTPVTGTYWWVPCSDVITNWANNIFPVCAQTKFTACPENQAFSQALCKCIQVKVKCTNFCQPGNHAAWIRKEGQAVGFCKCIKNTDAPKTLESDDLENEVETLNKEVETLNDDEEEGEEEEEAEEEEEEN